MTPLEIFREYVPVISAILGLSIIILNPDDIYLSMINFGLTVLNISYFIFLCLNKWKFEAGYIKSFLFPLVYHIICVILSAAGSVYSLILDKIYIMIIFSLQFGIFSVGVICVIIEINTFRKHLKEISIQTPLKTDLTAS